MSTSRSTQLKHRNQHPVVVCIRSWIAQKFTWRGDTVKRCRWKAKKFDKEKSVPTKERFGFPSETGATRACTSQDHHLVFVCKSGIPLTGQRINGDVLAHRKNNDTLNGDHSISKGSTCKQYGQELPQFNKSLRFAAMSYVAQWKGAFWSFGNVYKYLSLVPQGVWNLVGPLFLLVLVKWWSTLRGRYLGLK